MPAICHQPVGVDFVQRGLVFRAAFDSHEGSLPRLSTAVQVHQRLPVLQLEKHFLCAVQLIIIEKCCCRKLQRLLSSPPEKPIKKVEIRSCISPVGAVFKSSCSSSETANGSGARQASSWTSACHGMYLKVLGSIQVATGALMCCAAMACAVDLCTWSLQGDKVCFVRSTRASYMCYRAGSSHLSSLRATCSS